MEKKKKDRSKSCLFYMVEISEIKPLSFCGMPQKPPPAAKFNKNIQVVSGSKAGKKKKDRSKSCLFHMVEISGIEPLTS